MTHPYTIDRGTSARRALMELTAPCAGAPDDAPESVRPNKANP